LNLLDSQRTLAPLSAPPHEVGQILKAGRTRLRVRACAREHSRPHLHRIMGGASASPPALPPPYEPAAFQRRLGLPPVIAHLLFVFPTDIDKHLVADHRLWKSFGKNEPHR
jgi:hypothetical protein